MNNLRCFAYKDDEISHDFGLFDYSTFSVISLEYKKKEITLLAKPYNLINFNQHKVLFYINFLC